MMPGDRIGAILSVLRVVAFVRVLSGVLRHSINPAFAFGAAATLGVLAVIGMNAVIWTERHAK